MEQSTKGWEPTFDIIYVWFKFFVRAALATIFDATKYKISFSQTLGKDKIDG